MKISELDAEAAIDAVILDALADAFVADREADEEWQRWYYEEDEQASSREEGFPLAYLFDPETDV